MSRTAPRLFTIAPGIPFLRTLAETLLAGGLVPGWKFVGGNPLALADVTIYLPTRRAARELRSAFIDVLGGGAAILPAIRPLGEFDTTPDMSEEDTATLPNLPLPVGDLERVLALAPLVQAWKRRIPAQTASLIGEDLVVPASTADAIWLARDLSALMDEIETEQGDWSKLGTLVPDELAAWWQLSLSFLEIVTHHWPDHLAAIGKSSPAAWRNAGLKAEADRLRRKGSAGPVIAAGSTGSIPATADLLAAIATLEQGAVVLPGLDLALDEEAWQAVAVPGAPPASFGHPQTQLKRLLTRLGAERSDVIALGQTSTPLAARAGLVSEAMRPAETTERWAEKASFFASALDAGALDGVDLVEAANEREEALAIAIALRLAIEEEGRTAALVTGDRALARRVSAELRRFGIKADDSAGTPLDQALPATLLALAVETALRPGDPLAILSLLKHPLLALSLPREMVSRAAETIELVALRGGTGRPDAATLAFDFDRRLLQIEDGRLPFWWARIATVGRLDEARAVASALVEAIRPLTARRQAAPGQIADWTRASVETLEALARSETSSLADLYEGDAGAGLANALREMVLTPGGPAVASGEWPEVLTALMAGRVVKPGPGADPRVHIWGALEARLQSVDLMVLGGMNEGSWPRRAEADRFLSRFMKAGLSLDPPERRIGQSAHDFEMAMGAPRVVLTRAARAGDAPAVASRWLQRLLTCAGKDASNAMRARGQHLLDWVAQLDAAAPVDYAPRPEPKPPLDHRPRALSITEVETLRRDPYAVYARRVLGLYALDPLVRDPSAAERGSLFHDILHRFTMEIADPAAADAPDRLVVIGREIFADAGLPPDVEAVWWPRFLAMSGEIVRWERENRAGVLARHAEIGAKKTEIGRTGVTLSGRADRIDERPQGFADILDYKTGSYPSKGQAYTLLSPQLALEAALLQRGAFAGLGKLTAAELAYVRLKPDGSVLEDSILEFDRQQKSAGELAAEAWERLEKLVRFFQNPTNGYKSRTLPFREGDTDGDYDHLARVLEWSAGASGAEGSGE